MTQKEKTKQQQHCSAVDGLQGPVNTCSQDLVPETPSTTSDAETAAKSTDYRLQTRHTK